MSSMLVDAVAAAMPYYVGYIILYTLLAPLFKTEKHRSWILTGLASASMTLGSIAFVVDYLCTFANVGHGWGSSVASLRPSPQLAVIIVRAFQAYLVADLTVGALCYRSQISIVTGWAHHSVYVFIVELAIGRGWAHIFCLAAVMELPTLVLAIGTLYPRLRNNLVFALTFFTTRILFHVVLCTSFAMHWPTDALSGEKSAVPALILACILPLHLMWFRGCVNGFIKRAKARKLAAAVDASALRSITIRSRRVLLRMYISRALRTLPTRMDAPLRQLRTVRPNLHRRLSDGWGTVRNLRFNNPLPRTENPSRTLQQLDRPLKPIMSSLPAVQ